MSPASIPKLFTPLTLGGKNAITLQHRIVMAPLTRLRADVTGVQPDYAATYYKQRSSEGGLIITEATSISPFGRGYIGVPGIYEQAQIEAWKPVAEAVHAQGGVIFLQIWHAGRLSHPDLTPGNVLPVSSSSNMPIDETRTTVTQNGRVSLVKPRALETEEIQKICEDFRIATENAIAAGFDGVEVHAANGFLIELFLHDGINDRTDKYGGSIENRARFLFEVLDAILKTTPSSKVGVRLSPYGKSCSQQDSDPAATYSYVFDKLNDYDLAGGTRLLQTETGHVRLLYPQQDRWVDDFHAVLSSWHLKGQHLLEGLYHSPNDRADQDKVIVTALLKLLHTDEDIVPRFHLMQDQYLLFFDGGSRGNPGPGGSGSVVVRMSDRAEIMWAASMAYNNTTTTNNLAEFQGLCHGLSALAHHRWYPATVIGDSNMILGLMRRRTPTKSRRLRPLFDRANALTHKLHITGWHHHYRDRNKMADKAANIAMDTRTSFQALASSGRTEFDQLASWLASDVEQWLNTRLHGKEAHAVLSSGQ